MAQRIQIPYCIGVDVGKDRLEVAIFGTPGSQALSNRKAALLDWLDHLPPGSYIGLESTGRYHELLAELAHARGFVVYLLNPRDVRHYSQGVGKRAKTDAVDAQVIARYIEREHAELHPWRPPWPAQRELTQLLARRAKVVETRDALRKSLADLPALESACRATLEAFHQLLRQIDRLLLGCLKAMPGGVDLAARLRSIPGIGTLNALALSNVFLRYGFANSDAAVAYTGLDPRPDDSSTRRGRRRLSKRGPAELRRLLYNAAMAACKNVHWKPFYQRGLAQGLSTTEALVVLARKLVRVAYGLFKSDSLFEPAKLAAA